MKSKKESFGIIGLGRFGSALAKTLSEAGQEILVVDSNERKIKKVLMYTENAFVVENLNKESLEEVGIQNCDTVVVCIGEKIDTSILTTLDVVSLGVKRVITKAISAEQGYVLKQIGAEVVYPENDMAIRLANRLISSRIMESIALNDDIDISELQLTSKVDGKSIVDVDLRKNFGLNIIAIERNGETIVEILPEYLMSKEDLIVVVGKRENIRRFEDYLL